jgi:hypothetical protein
VQACQIPNSGSSGKSGPSEPPATRAPPYNHERTGVARPIASSPKISINRGATRQCSDGCSATTTPSFAASRTFSGEGHR